MRIRTTENTRKTGGQSEQLAVEFLKEKGYEIIKTNFVFGQLGELDIIAKDKNILVFVEVKSRKSYEYGSPEESINPQKRKNIRRVAEAYLYVNKITNMECRFDFIGIDKRGDVPKINHIINAF